MAVLLNDAVTRFLLYSVQPSFIQGSVVQEPPDAAHSKFTAIEFNCF